MSPLLIGADAGAAIGLASALFLRSLAAKIEARDGEKRAKSVALLRATAIIEFLFLTLMGAFLGHLVLGG
jgi:hypothetical protein